MSIRPRAVAAAFAALVPGLAWACSQAPDGRLPTPVDGGTRDEAVVAEADPEDSRAALVALLDELAAALAAHDDDAARGLLSSDFRGTWLERTARGEPLALPLETLGKREDVTGAATYDGPAFVAAFDARFAGWHALRSQRWSLESALFERDGARVVATGTLRVDVVGRGTAGAWSGLEARAAFSAVGRGGAWTLSRFALTELVTSQRPDPLFTDVAAAVGLADDARDATAVAAGDVDRDGLWDLFVAGRAGNRLYLARSDGAYVEAASERGVATPGGASAAVLFDFDGDTDQDLLLAAPDGVRLFANDGQGAFAERTSDVGLDVRHALAAATVFDWDFDGLADVFLGCVEPPREILLRNVDGRRFEDISDAAGLSSTGACASVAIGDYDYDGYADLYVVDPLGPNRLYHRERDEHGRPGRFVDHAESRVVGGEPGGRSATFTDVDQDGLLDVYLVNAPSAPSHTVFLTRGYGWFARALPTAGGVGPRGRWSPLSADFDLDGRVDLFVAGGAEQPGFWLGGAEDAFTDLSLASGFDAACIGKSAIAADLDDDGDVDLFVPSSGGGTSELYRNDMGSARGYLRARSYLKVQLMATASWYEAAGATVLVTGKQGRQGTQAQVLARGSGYRSCQPPELVFGLGHERSARVEVRWPGGMVESFGWVNAGTRVLLAQSVGRAEVLGALTFELGGAPPSGDPDAR